MERRWTSQVNSYGIPLVKGASQLDVIEAIGYINAKDRLMQMDYYRRFVTGRLSEVYGFSTLQSDVEMAKFDFDKVAKDVVKGLCINDIQKLKAFCRGVNEFIDEGKLPLEYEVLDYVPEKWTPESCILINIYTHYILNYQGLKDEEMMTILKSHLDEQLFYFYTPDKDRYSDFKIFGKKGNHDIDNFPREQLEAFYKEANDEKKRIRNSIKKFLNRECQVKICFVDEISYESFRNDYISGKIRMTLLLEKENFQVELRLNPRTSEKLNNFEKKSKIVHIEGYLPKHQNSALSNDIGFCELMVSADINIESFDGIGKLSIVENEYFKSNQFATPKGSNCMIVDGKKTKNGKPLFANDPHLSFTFPNLFYMLALKYKDVYFQGFMVPGTPLMVSGNNKNICWGITSTASNFFDLVIIDSQKSICQKCVKTIKIMVSKSEMIGENIYYYKTDYGPLLEHKLDGENVAVKWTAMDASVYDYSFFDIIEASSTEEAVEIAQKAGCVPVNIIIGDVNNNIAWTIAGKVPKRVGIKGDSAEKWKNGTKCWNGYILPEEKPIIVNPMDGFIVNANDRTYGSEYPYLIGHDFANGWRTKRISDLLSNDNLIYTKEIMGDIMNDLRCEPYDIYYQMIQSAFEDINYTDRKKLECVAMMMSDWQQTADKNCQALLVINAFRDKIIQHTLSPIYYVAGKYQDFFSYQWFKFDEIVMTLWHDQDFYGDNIASYYGYETKKEFFISVLYDVKSDLIFLSNLIKKDINELTWGDINRLNVNMQAVKFARFGVFSLINSSKKLPKGPLNGSIMSVNACFNSVGPLYRLVIDLDNYKSQFVNLLGGNYGSLLTDSKYTETSKAWAEGKLVETKIEDI